MRRMTLECAVRSLVKALMYQRHNSVDSFHLLPLLIIHTINRTN